MRRAYASVALLLASGCTSLLGIDGDYTLGETSEGGASSGSESPDASTGSGAGATTGTTNAEASSSGSGANDVTSSGSGGDGGGGGGGGNGAGGGGGPPATCDDEAKNGDETDTDCGGRCEPCGFGRDCGDDDDCVTGNCAGEVCACPLGRVPEGGGCDCASQHVACGDGPADICVRAIASSGPKLLDAAEAPGTVRLAANPSEDIDDELPPHYALYWAKPTSGTALARYEVDGTPRGEPIDVDDGDVVPFAVYPDWLDEVVLATDAEAGGDVSLRLVEDDADVGAALPILDGANVEAAVSAALSPSPNAERALAYIENGALGVVTFNTEMVHATVEVAPDDVTAVAMTTASLNGGFLVYGVAFVRDGELYFARFDTQGQPVVPVANLDPIDLDDVDLDRPIYAAADGGRWYVGGTSTAGGIVVGVLDAGASLAETVRVTSASTALTALVGGDDYVHVVWTEGVDGRPWFTRLATTEGETTVELPFREIYTIEGTIDVLDVTRMGPSYAPNTAELGIVYRVSQSTFEELDGIYLSRLGMCPL